MEQKRFIDRYRVAIAKYSLLVASLFSVLFGLMAVATVIACLGGCSGQDRLWEFAVYAVFSVACIAIAVSLCAFVYRLYRHGWAGLVVWERAVVYVGLLAALSPVLLNVYFWLF